MKTIKAEVTWTYYENGQLECEEYYIEGKRHNPNGPAYIAWCENGQLKCESYYIEDKLHNPNGPAYRSWWAAGQLRYEKYWIDGKLLTKEQFENRNTTCNNKIVEIDGKKYRLQEFV